MSLLQETSETLPSSGAVAARLQHLLAECIAQDASDLHLSAGRVPYVRVHGRLVQQTSFGAIASEELEQMGRLLADEMRSEPLGRTGSLDGSLSSAEGVRFRFNVFRRQGKAAIALRRLEDRLHTLPELGLPDSLYDVCGHSHGLVVVAGPTGSGKSTTLAALLDRINRTRQCHIVTIEDPIEYLHEPIQALVNQRQIGSDAGSFHEALVASLRQDPDVILVGEIRDLNTIRTAITAAETGHLVFTTVHAGDCVGAIERLVSVFPAEEQLGVRRQIALVLRWIVAQQLLVADGSRIFDEDASGILSRRRVVASEVLRNTSAVANLVATGKSNQITSAMESGTGLGMQTMEHDLARLWMEGYLSEESATTLARNPSVLRERADRIRQGGGAAERKSVRSTARGPR